MKSIQAYTVTWAAGVLAVTAVILTPACDSATSPEIVPFAVITIAVDPDPVSTTASTNPDFDWLASFTVTLTESSGTGAAIGSISVDVTETSDGTEVETDEDVTFQADVNSEADRVEGAGSTQISFNIYYTLRGGNSEARIDIELPITDDNGNEVGGTLQVSVE